MLLITFANSLKEHVDSCVLIVRLVTQSKPAGKRLQQPDALIDSMHFKITSEANSWQSKSIHNQFFHESTGIYY